MSKQMKQDKKFILHCFVVVVVVKVKSTLSTLVLSKR